MSVNVSVCVCAFITQQRCGQDQYCGRVVTGLDITDPNFDVLPPHFMIGSPILPAGRRWSDYLPAFTDLPASFQSILPYLLAALIYHRDFLDQELAANHPLRMSAVWTSGLLQDAQMRQRVLSGQGTHPVSGMVATGIPPHVILQKRIASLEDTVRIQMEDTRNVVERERRDLWAALQTELKALPVAVKEELLKNIRMDGMLILWFLLILTYTTHFVMEMPYLTDLRS